MLAPGDVFLNADFGYQPSSSGSIGDTVWVDANRNNSQDAGEPGIAGVTVSLIKDLDGDGTWDAGEPIIATDITDENGVYGFTGLPVADGTGTDDYLVWVNDTPTCCRAHADLRLRRQRPRPPASAPGWGSAPSPTWR